MSFEVFVKLQNELRARAMENVKLIESLGLSVESVLNYGGLATLLDRIDDKLNYEDANKAGISLFGSVYHDYKKGL